MALLVFITQGCQRKKLEELHVRPDSLERDFEISWSKSAFPLKVYVDTNLHEELKAAVAHASFTWNEALEQMVFKVDYMDFNKKKPKKPCGWIAVVQDDQMTQDGLWRAKYTDDGIVCAAQINLKWVEMAGQQSLNNIAIHEFGHALGLAHDKEDMNSIMHPSVWDDYEQYITQEDITALKEYYFSN